MKNTMQAVWISTYGGPEVLEIRTVGKPLLNDETGACPRPRVFASTALTCFSARGNIRLHPAPR